MAIISSKYINTWKPGDAISSNEAREEFKNIYSLVNGNIDAENIRDNSITGSKLQDGTIKSRHIESVDASKLTGNISADKLPTELLKNSGGILTGPLTFNVDAGTPLLRNYDTEEVILYEVGSGEGKIKIIVGGPTILRITLNEKVMWQLGVDGVEEPNKFKVPVVTNAG